jgi:hypothetical protein
VKVVLAAGRSAQETTKHTVRGTAKPNQRRMLGWRHEGLPAVYPATGNLLTCKAWDSKLLR